MSVVKTPRRWPGKMVELVLRSLFRKPATVRYPYEKIVPPAHFRGEPRFHMEVCTGCKLCVRDCPAQAITITKVGEKRFEASLDLGKCIYCGQCADVCPRAAVEITTQFELAQLDRRMLKVVFHAEPVAEPRADEKAAGKQPG